MSIRHTLLAAIRRDPLNAEELVETTGLARKIIVSNLHAAASDGLIHREPFDDKVIYRITAAGLDWLARDEARSVQTPDGETPTPAPMPEEPPRLTDDGIPQFIAGDSPAESAQPASGASNPGSHGTGSLTGTTSSPGAVASIPQAHAQELADALERITELQGQLEIARELRNHSPHNMLREVQTYIEHGTYLVIGPDHLRVGWGDDLYDATLDDFLEVIDHCAALDQRLVA